MINFQRLTTATCGDALAIEALLPQLSSTPHTFSLSDLQTMLSQPLVAVYVARRDGFIVGMLTLVGYHIPTGQKWQLEDVVLDVSLRGHGVAREMLSWAMADFRKSYPKAKVYLTSRPSRVAANALYASLGFKKKETNNYVF